MILLAHTEGQQLPLEILNALPPHLKVKQELSLKRFVYNSVTVLFQCTECRKSEEWMAGGMLSWRGRRREGGRGREGGGEKKEEEERRRKGR